MLTVTDVLFPRIGRVVIFSHSHRLDPAWAGLKERIEARVLARGEDPKPHPFTFENLKPVPRILAEQRERVQVAKDLGKKRLSQLLILVTGMLGEMRNNTLGSVVTRGRH